MKFLILVAAFYSCLAFSRTNPPPSEMRPGPVNYSNFNGDFEGTGYCQGSSFTMRSNAQVSSIFIPGDYYERVTQINGPTQTMEASCFSTNTTIVRKAVGNGNKVALHITYIEDCCLSLNPLCRDKVIARKTQTFTAEGNQMSVNVWGQGQLASETHSCVYRRVR